MGQAFESASTAARPFYVLMLKSAASQGQILQKIPPIGSYMRMLALHWYSLLNDAPKPSSTAGAPCNKADKM